MLVLTRKPNESLFIGNDIEIKIISCDKRGIRLGIEAPKEISIVRKELLKEAPLMEEAVFSSQYVNNNEVINAWYNSASNIPSMAGTIYFFQRFQSFGAVHCSPWLNRVARERLPWLDGIQASRV